ncbi:ferritin-like domain-containing protein [Sphingopyxis sp. CCNWLW253]|uniref:ferritin-like domain-containing protein n=1 Tax=unclassified Sphingopyxis TaxID=2614943 RepID=UPI003012E55F
MDDVKTAVSREKLLHALYEAAELEQNLMCTYLYAAFSLKDGEGEGLSAAEGEAIARWRRAILDVAVDEMSHLVAVWNITSALGGAPRFGRTNFPIDAGYLPAGIVVKLAPFSAEVIQHFIFLERPETSAEPDGDGFAVADPPSRTPVAPRLTPAGYDYATIGIFYQTIEADLRALVDAIGEKAVFCGDPALQLSSAEVNLAGARAVTDLNSALAALTEIIVEGEGAPSDLETSHFHRFLTVRAEMQQLSVTNPGFVAAHPAAVNPVLRKPPRPEGRVWLENADAIAAVDLANAIYALSLRLLAGAFALPRANPDKALYTGCAIGLMHALTAIAERAARLPAGPSNPGCNAGVSFTALREAASLPQGTSARRLYIERVEELGAVAAAMDTADPRCDRAARILLKQADRLRSAPLAATALSPIPPSGAPVSQAAPAGSGDQAEGKDVTVNFDGRRCIHARVCVTQAPATFLAGVEGAWITPDETDVDQLCSVIRQCPSGALSYQRRDGKTEPVPPVNLIGLRENGPYAVRADMVLDGARAGFRATLCRCGASKNKPFCDKSHKYIGFEATGEPPGKDTPKLAFRDGPLAIDPELDGPLQVRGNLEIVSGTGRAIACVETARLCRCGGSGNKPFCDGTHRKIGFRSE